MTTSSFPIEVQELRRPSVVHVLTVKWADTIKDIKVMVQNLINYPSSRMQILRSSNSSALGDSRTLGELGVDRGHTLIVSLQFNANPQYVLEPVAGIPLDTSCKEMVCQVRQGLNASQQPAKTDLLDCTGGVYFMKSAQGGLTAVFKPQDEEQGMPSNPKGHAGMGKEGLRSFLRPGEGFLHEAAAYLLDHGNFCQVPPTVIAHLEHPNFHYPTTSERFPKIGSLQRYVRASDTFEDISPSLIGTLELQKIALLDIRLLNCDRNASNILAIRKAVPHTFNNGVRPRRGSRSGSDLSWTESEQPDEDEEVDLEDFLDESMRSGSRGPGSEDLYELIPIDHGYCFPSRLLIEDFDWAWFDCPQIAKPVDPAIKDYLYSLDIEDLLRKLSEKVVLSEESLFLVRLVHHLLVWGVSRGLTLRDIAGLIVRTEDGKPSALEKVIASAEDNALRTLEVHSSAASARHSHSSSSTATAKSPLSRGRSPVTVSQSIAMPSPLKELPVTAMRRVVNSELFLAGLGGGGAGRWKDPNGIAYLSSENILRLQQSPDLALKRQKTAFPEPSTPAGPADDYFMKDLPPAQDTKDDSCCSIAVAPSTVVKPIKAPAPGEPITHLRSLDTYSSHPAAPPSTAERLRSYLTGSWLCANGKDADGDLTSSEASSSDFGTSPRSSSHLDGAMGSGRPAPFSSLGVVTEHPVVFDKPSRRRQRSDTTDDEESNASAVERLSLASTSSDVALTEAVPMARVASFGALPSPALYDMDGHGRQLHLLKREKGRESTVGSSEFLCRRLTFAKEAAEQLVLKEASLKAK